MTIKKQLEKSINFVAIRKNNNGTSTAKKENIDSKKKFHLYKNNSDKIGRLQIKSSLLIKTMSKISLLIAK